MRSMRRVVLDPYTDTTPRSAAEPLRGGTTTTTTDEEARLQAAIAMTQLSTAASTLPGGHQVQWRHLAFGDTHREEEQTEEVRQNSQTFDGQMKMAVMVKGASNGAADPETGEIRSAPEVDTSMTVCQAQSGADQRVTGDTCVGNKRTEEGGESLSIFYVEEMSPELGKSSQSGKEIPSEYGVGEEVVIHESDFLEEPFAMGKFIRTAQSSSKSGEAVWTERTPDTNPVGECEDRFTASCEGTPIVKRKTVQALDDAIPSKILRQRKSSKNASLLQATQGVGRGPSKKYRSRTTGKGSQLATGTASQAHYDQAVRGMVFAFNPQGGVFISQAALAPIPMTIVQADRRLLAWLPSNAVSASHGLSLSATTSAFASSAASLPSYAVPQLCDLMPRVTYALPSTLPTSVSYSEDVDAKISSDAAAVTKLSTSKISGKRVKRLSVPGGKSEDARFRTHYSKETFQIRTFQVDEKMEKDETRIREGDEADQSIVGVPVTEFGMDNRIAQRLGIESNQGVDLSMRKSRKRIGDMPMISDTATVDIKTEPKPFTYSNFESCTSPLDLTTHFGSCGSLGTLRNVNTLSGPTTKIEQHDANYGDFENSKDKVLNRISNSGPTDYSLNQVRQDERGLVHSLRHGSRVIVKGTSPVRPTSLMKTEKKSPSAESSGDKYDISQNTICSSLSDSALGSYEGTLNFTNPELQAIRSKHTGSPLLPVSVRNLWPQETRDVANPMALCPSDNGHCEAVTSENTGHSRPGSQCSSDLQLESSRSLEECRLPPKKRRMPFDFQLEAQPSRDDLECANDLSKRSSGEETLEKVNHPEQATSNYQHHPLAVPLPTKYCSGGGSGGGGGFNSGSSGGGSGSGSGGSSETSQRIQEPSMRDSMPLTALEIIVKLEFREEHNDGVARKTATNRHEFESNRMSVPGNCEMSSFSSSSSSPSPCRTTTNCTIHSAIQPDEDGDLPLHVAVAQGLESVVDSLVSVMSHLDTPIDVFNKNRQTPLHVAVITNQREIMRKLLQAGACPNLSDRKGHNSVHLAVNNRCHECLRILLSDSKYPVDIDAMNYEGLMPLHLAVQLGDVHSVEALLSFGAQVNGVDGKNGRTALYYAAERSDLATAELLLQTGASPSIASYSGCLPVNAARSSGAMVKLLDRYSAGGNAVMERSAAPSGVCGLAMATTKTGNRDVKRSKQVKSRE